MKIYILYHPNSEHARAVEEYAHDYQASRGKSIELVSLETRDGATLAKLYDIVNYPAIIATRDDRQLLKHWEGAPLPLMEEVDGYRE